VEEAAEAEVKAEKVAIEAEEKVAEKVGEKAVVNIEAEAKEEKEAIEAEAKAEKVAIEAEEKAEAEVKEELMLKVAIEAEGKAEAAIEAVESPELKEKKEVIEAVEAIEVEGNPEVRVKKVDIEAEAAIEAEENPEVKEKKVDIEAEEKAEEEVTVNQEKRVKTKITLMKTKSTLNSRKELTMLENLKDIKALQDLLTLMKGRVVLEEEEKFLKMATERVTGVVLRKKPELTLISMLTKQRLKNHQRRQLKEKEVKVLLTL